MRFANKDSETCQQNNSKVSTKEIKLWKLIGGRCKEYLLKMKKVMFGVSKCWHMLCLGYTGIIVFHQ